MTKFNVGDRVEFQATAPDTAYTDQPRTPSHLNGSRGTVVRANIVIRVNWDEGSAARSAFESNSFSKDASNAASFTENLVLVTEPDRIPVGTRAKALSGKFKGATGEITNDDGTDLWEYTLRFDEPQGIGADQEIYGKHQLEVLPSDVPKPIAAEPTTLSITPESVREQAAAKRTEANEITKQITELVDKRNALQRDASDLDFAAQTIERLATP